MESSALSTAIKESQDVAAIDAILAKQSAKLDGPFETLAKEQPVEWESGEALSTDAKRWLINELISESQTEESAALRQVRGHLSDLACYKLCRMLTLENPDEDAAWPTFVLAVIGSPHQLDVLGREVENTLARKNGLELALAAIETLRRDATVAATHWLDHWANTASHSVLADTASKALASLADQQDVTEEELAELATPTLRLSITREIKIDCGAREFTVRLGPDGTLQYIDQDGARLSSLPRARTMDDQARFRVGRRQMRTLKKQLDEINEQTVARLSDAMVLQREWPQERWHFLFVDHPILSIYASQLVWERLGEESKFFTGRDRTKLVDSDGSVVKLEASDRIRIAHPVTMEDAEVAAWKRRSKGMQKPPFRQIFRAHYAPQDHGLDWTIVASKIGALYSGPLQKRAKQSGYRVLGTVGREVDALSRQLGKYELFVQHEAYNPTEAHEFGRVKIKRVAVRKGSTEVQPTDLRETEYSEFLSDLAGFAHKPQ